MKRKQRILFVVAAAVFLLAAMDCSRAPDQEPTPESPAAAPMPPGHPPASTPAPGEGRPAMPAVQPHKVVVPESVQGKWAAVRFTVVATAEGKPRSLEAPLGKATPIPGTDLSVEPVVFLPSFFMGDGTITSVTNDLANPAVKVIVRKGEAVVHEGWLFQNHPDVHPFQHPEASLTLAGAVPAS